VSWPDDYSSLGSKLVAKNKTIYKLFGYDSEYLWIFLVRMLIISVSVY
jgi:hypothetical protein